MAFTPVPNTARCCLKYTLFDQQVCNIMYFEKGSPWTASELVTLATAINSWVDAELLPLLSADMKFVGTEARSMEAESAPSVEVAISPPLEGDVANAGLPGNVALAIKFATGLTGRSFRGRNYIAGWPEQSVTGNKMLPAPQAALVVAFEQLASYLVGLAANHVVASLFSGVDPDGKPIPRTTGVTTEVSQYTADENIDSMRKRLNGRGS
jgi:hypothetical protein